MLEKKMAEKQKKCMLKIKKKMKKKQIAGKGEDENCRHIY